METMRVQNVTPNDLPWKIRYDASRCTLCGSCVAACSFRAIEPKVERRRMVFSEGEFPEPKTRFSAVPVIRQTHSIKNYCRGCGICEKVCPNDAIGPLRNPDTRSSPAASAGTRSSAAGARTSKPAPAPWTRSGSGASRR